MWSQQNLKSSLEKFPNAPPGNKFESQLQKKQNKSKIYKKVLKDKNNWEL